MEQYKLHKQFLSLCMQLNTNQPTCQIHIVHSVLKTGFIRSDLFAYFLQSGVNDAPSRCSIFSQQGNILFMIYMNDKSLESLSADGHTQFYICLPQNN